MPKKTWIILISFMLPTIFASSSSNAPEWVDLDAIDQPARLAILKQQIFTESTHFGPLYQAAKDLQELFSHAKVPAMAFAGCTLGIARFGECLPWDDDIDYAVSIDQEDKIKELIPLAKKLGYNLFEDDLVGYKFYRDEPLKTNEHGQEQYVFIDIFLYQPENEKYILTREKAKAMFPRAWFTKREFETRTQLKCGPIMMPCSTYLKETLERFYTADYETKARFYSSHIKDIKTYYAWTIRSTDEYPSYKTLALENSVEKLLRNTSS